MPNETNVSELFWAASGGEPVPDAPPSAKSSCCGPKPAGVTEVAEPAASSCCGPKPAGQTEAKAKSSCCG